MTFTWRPDAIQELVDAVLTDPEEADHGTLPR